MQKLVGLQYLRGSAAVLVVFDHIRGMARMPRYLGLDPLPWLGYAGVGVDIFFTISGFIIMVVCFQPLTLAPRISVKAFLQHRFARIMPFLWVCVVAYAVLRWAGIGAFEWGPYVRALTLWPVGDVRPNVVWTLRHEALFYAVFAISMLWLRRPLLLALWCVSPIGMALAPVPVGDLLAFGFNSVNIEFGAGVLAGWMYLRQPDKFRRSTRQTLLVTLLLSLGVLVTSAALDLGARTLRDVLLLSVLSTMMVLFVAHRATDPRPLKIAGALVGDASYAIYLTHGMIVLACLEGLRRVAPSLGIATAYCLLALAAVLGGIAVHLLVERPLVRGAQRILGLRPNAGATEALPATQPTTPI